jgi:hypothetical protein
MITFESLWRNHVGRETICDVTLFENQCAMRMGKALEESGLSLIGRGLKRCTDAYPKLKHKPGHIRSAQDLANVFYYDPTLLGSDVKKQIFKGNINNNISSFEGKQGMVFT